MSDEVSELRGKNLVERLCELADKSPDRVLYIELLDGVEESSRLTAGELRDRASRLAGSLRESGVKPGEVVLMIATPPCEFLVGLMGCVWAGVIAAPIAFPRRVEHLSTRLEPVRKNAEAVAVVAAPAHQAAEQKVLEVLTEGTLPVISTLADGAEPMADPVGDSEIAYLQYTSGSTSEPRGVIVTHDNLMDNLAVSHELLDMDADSINVSWCPLTHDMGLIMGALPSIYFGMLSVLMPPAAFIRRPLKWFHAFDRYRGTHGYSPNFGYDLCVDRSTEAERAELDLSSVRVLINGAEPVRKHTRDKLTEAFAISGLAPTAHTPAYGLAEATVLVSATEAESAGRVVAVD
ncbi:MAG TPA: AMP-binding protein, partial [Solirubrobacterales bacterium]|nr:AMP-binding protein [Solirubrobacterales bacterium]